jgi:molybdate transport system permease protein
MRAPSATDRRSDSSRPERAAAGDRVLAVIAGAATAVLLSFVLLPVVALFTRVSVGELLEQLRSRVALDALWVSLRTSMMAMLLVLVLGTPAAYVLSTRVRRGTALMTTLLELPLVLPPPVAGLGLLVAFGRNGLLGGPLRAVGVSIPFTQVAVVLALIYVSLPFYIRQAVASFGAVDKELLAASRTLGVGAAGTFFRVALPLAGPGLSAGAALAWARALGEFGATLMFAGSLQGRTQTLPVAIFTELAQDFDVSLAISALLVVVSASLFVGIKVLLRAAPVWNEPWIESSESTSASV